jgi:major membrane immunogen (membrane-anchored lipoprotein)
MKKIIIAALVLGILVSGMSFADVKAKDGVYFSQAAEFGKTGWKTQVVVEVKGGKIVKVNWNGISNLPGAADKKAYSLAGKYGMEKAAKQGSWDKQAAAAESWLVKTQDVNFSKFDKDGKTDAISGATMTVNEFFTMVNQALAGTAVPKGIYKTDGWYYAEQPAFDAKTGWKDSVLVTVVNGTVVDALWNGTNSDATKKSKLIEATEGRYGMAKAAKNGEWNLQAAAVDAAIVKAQDPAKIAVKADGTSDAISGASIHVTAVSLAIEALKAAR